MGAVIAMVGFTLPSTAVDTMELLSAGVTGIALFFAGGYCWRSEERRDDSRLVVVAVATRLCYACARLWFGPLCGWAWHDCCIHSHSVRSGTFFLFSGFSRAYGTSSLAARIQAYGTFLRYLP